VTRLVVAWLSPLRTLAIATLLAGVLALDAPVVAAPHRFPAGDGAYHTYAELTAELQALADANPDTVLLSSAGKSYAGRDIWLVKISDHVSQDEAEPEVLMVGLTHAREHLTVEQALALIHWLVDADPSDSRVRSIVSSTEIWVMPMLNPDGGEFDIQNGRYHNWRKNRQPTPGSSAIGTDINRNFSYHWGCCGGASANPLAITYEGPEPFSTPEARAERDFVLGRIVDGIQQLRLSIHLHSFGAQVLYPYGYTKADVPADMRRKDHKALVALTRGIGARNGYRAFQGSANYITSGGAGDWSYGTQRVLSFTIELAPRTPREGGFYPAGDQVKPLTEANRGALLWWLEQAPCPYDAAGLTHACARAASAAASASVPEHWPAVGTGGRRPI
jgi:carboxypeptidase T